MDVDPTGEYIVAGGKLATVIPVHSFSKMQKAIADRAFAGEDHGIPVLKYEATVAGEVQNPGLGPLHTEFDGKGNAYTSMFLSSEIVKWSLKDFKVLDRAPTYYSIGHLMIPGGDSRKPWGKYVLALNKITKDRYLPTGPELAQSAQLYDISGDRMKLLLDFPTIGEPHYAQALPAAMIKDRQLKMYSLKENQDPWAAKNEKATRVERKGSVVHVVMTSVRSHFMPDKIEGIQVGDSVYFHLTNLEQDWDVPHGFAVLGANNSELLMMPGQTRTLAWVPSRRRGLSLLLHRLLLGAAPGDAGLHPGVARRARRWRSSGTARATTRPRVSTRSTKSLGQDGTMNATAIDVKPGGLSARPAAPPAQARGMRRLSQGVVAVASLLLLAVYVAPLWRIRAGGAAVPGGARAADLGEPDHGAQARTTSTASTGSTTTSGCAPIDPAAIPELRFMPRPRRGRDRRRAAGRADRPRGRCSTSGRCCSRSAPRSGSATSGSGATSTATSSTRMPRSRCPG